MIAVRRGPGLMAVVLNLIAPSEACESSCNVLPPKVSLTTLLYK